jgi:hypothetical protein
MGSMQVEFQTNPFLEEEKNAVCDQ